MNIILEACAIIVFLRNETNADVVRETLLAIASRLKR